ncbi:MAG TPA: TetR/AcrR family transcriptional regulator [Myxococcota bacterium]|nr:TetR/AcrR family transcriptional regulator [Myxococcota bacterium]
MTKHLPEEVRRGQILDAARKCFVEKGYFPTRMDDVARTAGLSKGGIYFHFDGKRQIFEALVRQEYEESAKVLRAMSVQPQSYREMFANLARHYLEFFSIRPDYPRFFMVMGEMAGRDESVREMLALLQKEYTGVIARIIQQGIDAGALKPVDPEVTATLLKGIIDAIEGYFAIGVDMDVERIMATGMEIIMSGLLR